MGCRLLPDTNAPLMGCCRCHYGIRGSRTSALELSETGVDESSMPLAVQKVFAAGGRDFCVIVVFAPIIAFSCHVSYFEFSTKIGVLTYAAAYT